MLEVHHVVALAQRQRVRRDAAGVAARTANASVATEDLVIGEHAKAAAAGIRDDESALQDTHRERRGRRHTAVGEQLVQTLALPGIVAKNHRLHRIAHDATQRLDVAGDCLGRAQREYDLRLVGHRLLHDRAERVHDRQQRLRRLEQLLPAGDVLPAPAREVDVMRRFLPRALRFLLDVYALRHHEESVVRPERHDRAPFRLQRVVLHTAVHGQHERLFHRARRALRRHVEVPQIHDLVAPELGPNRIRHPEAVYVEDAAAHAELGHILHHRHTLQADALEVFDQLGQPALVSLAQLDPEITQRTRHSRALQQRTRGRDEHAHIAAHRALQRLHALTRHLHVRLGFAEALARRIQRDDVHVEQGAEVRQPSFGIRQRVRDHHEEARGQATRERCHRRCVSGSGQPRDSSLLLR